MSDFKVGDEVEVLKSQYMNEHVQVGKIAKIISIERDNIGLAASPHIAGLNFKPNQIKLATKGKMNDNPKYVEILKTDWPTIDGLKVGTVAKVHRINSFGGVHILIGSREFYFAQYEVKLVDAPKQGKIIGYKLLKDLPLVKAGTEAKIVDSMVRFAKDMGTYNYSYVAGHCAINTEWFEPIYEVVKPTEVKVQTLAGEVTVTKSTLSLRGEVATSAEDATIIFNRLKPHLVHIGEVKSGTVLIDTFKVGCKTFSVKDIPKLEEAIKQVS